MKPRKWQDDLRARLEREDSDALLHEMAETFRVLGEPTRVRILMALVKEEMCVSHLAEKLGMSDSAISHQLRILRNSRLVRFRKEGKLSLIHI